MKDQVGVRRVAKGTCSYLAEIPMGIEPSGFQLWKQPPWSLDYPAPMGTMGVNVVWKHKVPDWMDFSHGLFLEMQQ